MCRSSISTIQSIPTRCSGLPLPVNALTVKELVATPEPAGPRGLVTLHKAFVVGVSYSGHLCLRRFCLLDLLVRFFLLARSALTGRRARGSIFYYRLSGLSGFLLRQSYASFKSPPLALFILLLPSLTDPVLIWSHRHLFVAFTLI